MGEYLHPGVYIEEQPAPQTIAGVSTSTAGFVGVTEKGPTGGLPQLITSFADFVRLYGSYLLDQPWGDTRFLAYAVEGFFNNGGQRVYIKRVTGEGAAPSALTLNDGFITRLLDDTSATATARNTVRLASLRGIRVGSQLTFRETIAGTDESQTQAVTSYDSATNSVTLDTALTLRYTAAGCSVVLSGVADAPEPSMGAASLAIAASSEGEWGQSIRVTTTDMDGAVGLAEASGVVTTLREIDLTFATNGPAAGDSSTVLEAASFATVADGDLVEFRNSDGDTEQRTITTGAGDTISWAGPGNGALVNAYNVGGSTAHRLTALRSGANNPIVPVLDTTGLRDGDLVRLTRGETTQLVQIDAAAGSVNAANRTLALNTGTLVITDSYNAGTLAALATAGRSTSNRLDLRSTRNFYPRAILEIDDNQLKTYHTVASIDGRSLVLTAPLGRDVGSGTTVRVVEFSLSLDDGVTSERFDNLSLDAEAPNFIQEVVNSRSRLVQITASGSTRPAPFHLPRTTDGRAANLTGGDNGGVPSPDDYRGVDNGPGDRTGIKALADIDNISIIAAPGLSDASVQAELIGQCELLQDRFAVLDPRRGSVIGSGRDDDIILQRQQHDTLYAALYYPWVRLRDPLYPNDREGRLAPPSGHVVGIYARVDEARGVHKAPANEVIRGITTLEHKLSDREQDVLNPHPTNINVLRDFSANNRGIRVWGSRVITSDNAWRYVPVRRLFIFLEESLDEGLQFVVFEPNAEPLWARVRQTIIGFLRRVRRDGALAGATEEESFFVRVDRTTMTPDDIANGRLIVLVGVAPVFPAEFVIIRMSQKTLESSN